MPYVDVDRFQFNFCPGCFNDESMIQCGTMEGNEEEEEGLPRIVELLAATGYVRARHSSLSPFDKLTGGLAWCLNAANVDFDIDLFYDDNASLDHKLKIASAIEEALQKIACPYHLQAHQLQCPDYAAVYQVMVWLNNHFLSTQGSFSNQGLSSIKKSYESPGDTRLQAKLAVVSLREQIAEMEKIKKILQEQKRGFAAQVFAAQKINKDQETRESELLLETKVLKEKLERAGAWGLVHNRLPLLEQCKVMQEEEHNIRLSCGEKSPNLTILQNAETDREEGQQKEDTKLNVESVLQQETMKLKLLRGDIATKNQEFIFYQHKLNDVPSYSELMQYERCFVELYLHIQAKLQETRKYFATYNALAEGNELTLKEISLLNSIHAQFEEVMTSQGGRSKFVASISDIAKGVSQKVDKMEARFLAEQNALSSIKKRHRELLVERRRYEHLMKLLQEECARNDRLQSSFHQTS